MPPQHLGALLGDLEKYIHADDDLPPLIRAGLAHVQFETIHPYLDGNGRIGRLLIALLLEHWGLLSAPLLYISLFFKRHRAEYYRRLNAVRLDGDWEGEIFAVVAADRARVLALDGSSIFAARLFELLSSHPIITTASAVQLLGTTKPTATRAIEALIEASVLKETTGRKRDRSFAYLAYVDRLKIGTDLESF
jgi:Fic family protein